jgi:pyruvate-ferredoxin/flavodoxin oxidoreductase
MAEGQFVTLDGNEAVAKVAFKLNEVVAIYPITPSSPMAEFCDEWASQGKTNLWGQIPSVVEMQSEGGAIGAAHGSLLTGSLTTTFTASQGLLLMIPNMFKIAGELVPMVIHVTARTLAAHALSIFGDHSDVMACRSTGFGLICSNSVQEAHDFAAIAHTASLRSRVPFLHFFDGFRTSHEVAKAELMKDDVLKALVDDKLVAEYRLRGMTPDKPILRGTAQNPDVFFQARESSNQFYQKVPGIVQEVMDQFAKLTGRAYKLYDYVGHPQAERIVLLMGSGAEVSHEAVDYLVAKGEKVGVLKVHLYRPLDASALLAAVPASVKSIAVMDRTKEPGASGEPLYLDVVEAYMEALQTGTRKDIPRIIGGRYGLSSKEFTPAMVKGVLDHLKEAKLKNHFTIGILDDVTKTSLPYDPNFSDEGPEVVRAMFYGVGSDGTVGANKNSIKIIGENTPNYANGYFVYDSKKSGSMTISHLRFGPKQIRSSYLVTKANFMACSIPVFLEKFDILRYLETGGTFLLNSPFGPDKIWNELPRAVQEQMQAKKVKFFIIDATQVARDTGMGGRTNTIMQTCFFAISGVLPRDKAIEAIKKSIEKTYGRKGEKVVQANLNAVDKTLENLREMKVEGLPLGNRPMRPPVPENAPEYVKKILGKIIMGDGDDLPVSAMPIDGVFPTDTTRWEKRDLALDIPVWEPDLCIQCNKCAFVCPHAVIRPKVFESSLLANAPSTFKSADTKFRDFKGLKYSLQVSPEDCTGCTLCVEACPVKSKTDAKMKAINMKPQPPIVEQEKKNWEFFLSLPEYDRTKLRNDILSTQQIQRPLFEFSGACAGCGETPYVKLASQLFGDRMIIANATGCSSIYGGNLPTTPWAKNAQGRGPTWCNSLFEDNAEFGMGFRMSYDYKVKEARRLLDVLKDAVGADLVQAILEADQSTETGITEQRNRVEALKTKLRENSNAESAQLMTLADALVKKSVWIMGGDGWAYDIGYGGLDHVLASGAKVNILVLDTEVYSNTGGQMSKSTPKAAVAKFATGGKQNFKKDMGLIAMTYRNVYIARVAMGYNDGQTLKAFLEAEAHPGPSLIIAYSHCISHGIDMVNGLKQQKAAVDSGAWILYRYNPGRLAQGQNPLQLDSGAPKMPLKDYLMSENRFRMLSVSKPEVAERLCKESQAEAYARYSYYKALAEMDPKILSGELDSAAPAAPATPAQA